MKDRRLPTKFISITLACVLALVSAIFVVSGGFALREFRVEFVGGVEEAQLYRGESVQYVHDYTEIVEPVFVNKGYNFAGWDVDSLSLITDHAVVTAKWKKYDFAVTFEGNGGITSGGETTIKQYFDSGINIVPPPFEREGYTAKWNVDFATIKNTCTLWAEWIPNEYSLTFFDGQTQLSKETVAYFSTVTLPKAPQRNGYKFLGWVDENGEFVDGGMHYDIASDTVLNAEWLNEAGASVITYELNGGKQLKGTDRSFVDGVTVTILDPVRDGYKFDGWEISGKNGVKFGNQITTEDFSGDVILSATWVSEKYTVAFDTKDGTLVGNEGADSVRIGYGETITGFPKAEKDGFVFVGWKLGGYEIKEGMNWSWPYNVTLVANYKRIYTVKFDLTAKIRGYDVECEMVNSGSISLEENQTIEQIGVQIVEGQTLIQAGVNQLPSANPIEPRGVDEYSYAGFWRYYYNGKNYKVYPDTIVDDINFPGAYETGIIVIRPSCRAHWTPPY